MRTFLVSALAITMTAALALAQGPGPNVVRITEPGQMPLNELKTHLSLTDAQVTQLQQLQQQLRTANQAIHEQLFPKEQSLRQTLQSGTTDATAVGKLVLEIEALRKQLKASRDNAVTSATAVLSGAQKAKLAELEAAAKLEPAIHQAHMMNLLSTPDVMMFRSFGGPDLPFEAGAVAAAPVMIRRVEIRK